MALPLIPCRTKKLSLAAAEERMAQYWRVGEEAWAAGVDQDVLFVRVRCAGTALAARVTAAAATATPEGGAVGKLGRQESCQRGRALRCGLAHG
jgi:hypothetical protein